MSIPQCFTFVYPKFAIFSTAGIIRRALRHTADSEVSFVSKSESRQQSSRPDERASRAENKKKQDPENRRNSGAENKESRQSR